MSRGFKMLFYLYGTVYQKHGQFAMQNDGGGRVGENRDTL